MPLTAVDDAPIGALGEQFVQFIGIGFAVPGGPITGCPFVIGPVGTNSAAPFVVCPFGVGNEFPVDWASAEAEIRKKISVRTFVILVLP